MEGVFKLAVDALVGAVGRCTCTEGSVESVLLFPGDVEEDMVS